MVPSGVGVVCVCFVVSVISWVAGMVNVFPESLDAVAFETHCPTVIEGASPLQSSWIQMV